MEVVTESGVLGPRCFFFHGLKCLKTGGVMAIFCVLFNDEFLFVALFNKKRLLG